MFLKFNSGIRGFTGNSATCACGMRLRTGNGLDFMRGGMGRTSGSLTRSILTSMGMTIFLGSREKPENTNSRISGLWKEAMF